MHSTHSNIIHNLDLIHNMDADFVCLKYHTRILNVSHALTSISAAYLGVSGIKYALVLARGGNRQ